MNLSSDQRVASGIVPKDHLESALGKHHNVFDVICHAVLKNLPAVAEG